MKNYLFVILLLGYCIYHLFNGNNGLITYFKIREEIIYNTQRLADLKQTQDMLQRKVDLMRPNRLCKDLLEEQVRKMIHYSYGDDLVILDGDRG